ncbi:MAG: branched-chain amino acid ABC transporter permease [Paracoccaceae bacterium]|nr:branched-chain amino acid ABC transporter permease [Paracoccaceae bacterium]
MSLSLFLVQSLNGLQFGILLFLIAAGLTLVFGVMGFINLSHGVQYMIGAYLTFMFYQVTGSFFMALILGLVTALAIGLACELLIFRHLYTRDHLDQVLATFGIILFVNEAVKAIWGPSSLILPPPESLSWSFEIIEGLQYPIYRLAVIAVGIAVAFGLYVVVFQTRVGMLIRAGATNPDMVSALGVDINRLFTFVFGFGAMLAGFAGAIAAPMFSLEPSMGDDLLIVVFVVIIIGGIGSIRGAFIAAVMVGMLETLGRAVATDLLKLVFDASAANQIGPALSSMLIYILMAAILFFKPEGLFPARGGA